jgi:RHS repeat-associated protein
MIWGHEPSQGWGLLEERGPNGELLARHVHGPNVDDLVLSELNGAVYFYHQDHLNSTTAVTDESGNVVEQYRYDVYGQPFFYGPDGARRGESALGIRFLFTGREWLSSLALYDYRDRAYSPALGRFLQIDPLGLAAGQNLYVIVMNSVVFLSDPFGLLPPWYLRPSTITAVAGGIIGAISVFNPAVPFIGALSISLFGHSILFLWLESEEEKMEQRERDREVEELRRQIEELNKELDRLRKCDQSGLPERMQTDTQTYNLPNERFGGY